MKILIKIGHFQMLQKKKGFRPDICMNFRDNVVNSSIYNV